MATTFIHQAKIALGQAAANLIRPGMLVGLGTGSTAECFIDSLGVRCRNGLEIRAVSSSEKSKRLAIEKGIPIVDDQSITTLDITVDGADEIDLRKRMIKGGGGALLREKILASISQEMIVIVDETKLVQQLGRFPLPVEVLPFACHATFFKLQQLGYSGHFRKTNEGTLFLTDNSNFIIDIPLSNSEIEPEEHEARIKKVIGVLEVGFFCSMAGRVLVGRSDGKVEIKS